MARYSRFGRIAPVDCHAGLSRKTANVAHDARHQETVMKKYVIERDIPGVDKMSSNDLGDAAKTSNAALAQLAPTVQWVQSYVAKDKTFCVYIAENEDAIREHARLSGFPANKITEITGIFDPTTARA
jgi:hypothetical protein